MNVVHRLLQRVNRTEYWYGEDDEVLDREAVRVIQQLEDENGRLHAENMTLRIKLNSAIERCAFICKSHGTLLGSYLAEKIRALKDEP